MPEPQQVFVIRIWLERGGGQTVSRGYVEHVASGERRYFVDLNDVLEYVAAVGPPAAADGLPAADREG